MTGLETYDVTEEKLLSVTSPNTSLSHPFSIIVHICVHMEAHVQIKRGPARGCSVRDGAFPSSSPSLPHHWLFPRELSLYSVLHMHELVEQKHRHIQYDDVFLRSVHISSMA